MQLHFTVDTHQDTVKDIQTIANALNVLAGQPSTLPAGAGQPGAGPAPTEALPDNGKAAPKAKAAPAAKAKANGKAAPKDKGDDGEEQDEPEDEGPDYGALRLDLRGRFASWAEQVGMVEGKALLDSFDVAKFSELDNSQLAGFGKALTRAEAEL